MANNTIMQKIFEAPLYEKIEITEDIKAMISAYLNNRYYNELAIDLYCPSCKKNATYIPSHESQLEINQSYLKSELFWNRNLNFAILHYRCSRDQNHYSCVQIILDKDSKSFIKIGQFPSKADFEFPEYNKYSKILPKEQLADLKRAAGLASHGIGAGSFVYLRRVFEFLLNQAYEHVKNEVKEEDYIKLRVNERIQLLKNYLPEFMHENNNTYGILSKGVHELTEDECLDSFNLMKQTIEYILEESLAKKKEEEKKKSIKEEMTKLANSLNSKKKK